MSEPLLEARGMGCRYRGGPWALREVTITIQTGSRLAVLGTNGAGKSTLLLALAGALPLAEGHLLWKGEALDSSHSRRAFRDSTGLLLQDPEDQLFSPTVAQDVAFGLVQRGINESEAGERVRPVLEALTISHLATRQVHHLSLGEKRKVALAGLIVLRPALLLLDEPTAGLDSAGTRALLDSLTQLHAKGVAVVLTTHDTNLAAQWATGIAVLDGGRITAFGSKQQILSDFAALHRAGLEAPLSYAAASAILDLFPGRTVETLPASACELARFLSRLLTDRPHGGSQ